MDCVCMAFGTLEHGAYERITRTLTHIRTHAQIKRYCTNYKCTPERADSILDARTLEQTKPPTTTTTTTR